jgi:chemotaxis protein CheZ
MTASSPRSFGSDPVLVKPTSSDLQMMISIAVRDAVRSELTPIVAELRHFVDRRFDEVSSELHAVLEFFDLSEHKVQEQLQAMRAELAQVVNNDPSSHELNSGVELEAVIRITEAAANKIMEAAESIVQRLDQQPDANGEASGVIRQQLNAIFEACSFQDLTGQRVRRAIDRLARIEGRLQFVAQHLDSGAVEAPVKVTSGTCDEIRQDAVDALLRE